MAFVTFYATYHVVSFLLSIWLFSLLSRMQTLIYKILVYNWSGEKVIDYISIGIPRKFDQAIVSLGRL